MVDLTTRQRQQVQQILHHRFPGRKTQVFGSRAKGQTKPWSDLDLVLLGDQPVSDLALAEARADFEESDLPFRVDLSLWTELPSTLQQSIQRHGKPL